MTAAVSRTVLSLAVRCLGTDRREWALAMQAEFEAAVDDGKPFAFALGCLVAAWCEMVKQGEGRLVLAKYALALGLLIPMAALQFEQAMRFSMFLEEGLPYAMQAASAGQNPYLIWSQNSAAPTLLILWLLLGMAQLCLAWVLVEGDWPRVVKVGALIAAATITLSLFTGVLMLDLSPLIAQVAEQGIALAAIIATARWHARLFSPASPDLFAS
jgi:hypothetical protein